MFLERVLEENKELVEVAIQLHQQGAIEPDSYIIDVDTVLENGRQMVEKAKEEDIALFLMTKQFGRNAYLAAKLITLGFRGVVAVDMRDAQAMMQASLPLSHVGHLVQVPTHQLREIITYGVDYLTVYSLEKIRDIHEVCKVVGKVQPIFLKVHQEGDSMYPSQEGGFHLNEIHRVIQEIRRYSGIKIAGITAFPCFLYNKEEKYILPTQNVETLKETKKLLEEALGYPILTNMPSCTQKDTLPLLKQLGADQGEPGSSLLGMTPNKGSEKISMVYVSEVSHQYEGNAYCYGGGYYRRSMLDKAWIKGYEGVGKVVLAHQPDAESIDYTIKLEGEQTVGSTVVMCFRTQVFVTRSKVVLVEGIQQGKIRIVGIYDSQGRGY